MFSRVHSATVPVSNQEAALDFYVNTLGWKKSIDMPMEGPDRFITVVPADGSTELALSPAQWLGPDRKVGGASGIALITPDIDETYKTLSERGVKFKEPVTAMPWGQKATWFYDQDGNEFFLVEEVPQE